MTLCRPDGPALVLGSAQDERRIDHGRLADAGVPVVRRRSGGGIVLLVPGQSVWIDVDVPAADVLWEADVGRAFVWLGRAWADALGDLGVAGPRSHAGPMEEGRWGRLVCFAGLGPGEVTVTGRKLVGIAQRRTRAAARFQCAVLLRWEAGPLVDLLAVGEEERAGMAADLASCAVGLAELGVAAAQDEVLAALRARLS